MFEKREPFIRWCRHLPAAVSSRKRSAAPSIRAGGQEFLRLKDGNDHGNTGCGISQKAPRSTAGDDI